MAVIFNDDAMMMMMMMMMTMMIVHGVTPIQTSTFCDG